MFLSFVIFICKYCLYLVFKFSFPYYYSFILSHRFYLISMFIYVFIIFIFIQDQCGVMLACGTDNLRMQITNTDSWIGTAS